MLKAIKDAEEDLEGQIRVRFILSMTRIASFNEQAATDVVDIVLAMIEAGEKHLVGIELSGDPRVGKFSDFVP